MKMSRNRKRKKPIVVPGRFFTWRLSQRTEVWQADGRSNRPNAGRHSLGTTDHEEALRLVHDLDVHVAVDLGIADSRLLTSSTGEMLALSDGLTHFEKHIQRPEVSGGPKVSTQKRYLRILRAFRKFAAEHKIRFWQQVDANILNDYATYRAQWWKKSTVVTELSLLKQVRNHLVEHRHLDAEYAFAYRIRRPKQSTRYCPTPEEVQAILKALNSDKKATWLYNIVLALAHTGLRLGELAQITSDDIDQRHEFLTVRDEWLESGDKSTKTALDRKIPLQPAVREILPKLAAENEGLLFRGPRGGKVISETFGNGLRKFALEPLKAKFKHRRFMTITAHCFRHFFSSYCAGMGIPQQMLMDWMGHRTDSMAKRYYHSDDVASLRNIQKLAPLTEPKKSGEADES